jgi:hypothetical protein
MKNQRIVLWTLIALTVPLAVAGCRSRTDRSQGTVLLSVSHYDQLPFGVSLTNGPFVIGTVTLRNVAKDPTGTTSNLQDVELRSYQITYTRRDTGTRVPPPSVQGIFGNVPVDGTTDLINTVGILFSDQLLSQPLKDLHDFGVDRETGTAVIVLDVSMTFFGRTLSGDDIASAPATFTLEVRQ